MADIREQILARLVEIAATVPDVRTALRNRAGVSDTARPAIIVMDADEAAEDEQARGGMPPLAPQLISMTPEFLVLVSERAADIGAELSAFRRRIIRRVLSDAVLLGLVGSNGSIRYSGSATALGLGRTMEGEMGLSFDFRYVLKPADLED